MSFIQSQGPEYAHWFKAYSELRSTKNRIGLHQIIEVGQSETDYYGK
jgi:hypothetical protein